MNDKQAKAILKDVWRERTRLWERPDPDGWWMRARPGPRSPVMPYLKTPGAKLFKTQPDGLWLYLSGQEWADAICIEHCSSIQNLNDKRSRYMPSLSSILVRITRTWLNGDVGVQNNGTAPRWETTGTMAQPDLMKEEFHIPIRQLRVLYALRPQDYTRWIPNHIPTGYEFFCTHPSLNTFSSPSTQTFLKRMSSVAHRLTIP